MNNAVNEIAGIFSESPMCFIATISGNEPRVRAFQYQFEQDGKLWFCTAKSKDVFKQIQANPSVQICAVKQDMTWVRVTAKVSFEDNRSVKEHILDSQPLIKNIYGTVDNPEFTTFCIEHGTYVIANFSGNPPYSGSF